MYYEWWNSNIVDYRGNNLVYKLQRKQATGG